MIRKMLCGGATIGAFVLAIVPATAAVNDLACFAVKDQAEKGKFEARLGSEMAGVTCKVKMPAVVACVRTTGTTTTPPLTSDADASKVVLCYRAKCSPSSIATMKMADAVGQHTVRMRGGKLLCLPATTTAVIPTASTTTTLPEAEACDFRDGGCRGSCAGTAHCGAVFGSQSCECQTTSCGEASAPQCSGFCIDPRPSSSI